LVAEIDSDGGGGECELVPFVEFGLAALRFFLGWSKSGWA
jgi:hypothetical protein